MAGYKVYISLLAPLRPTQFSNTRTATAAPSRNFTTITNFLRDSNDVMHNCTDENVYLIIHYLTFFNF